MVTQNLMASLPPRKFTSAENWFIDLLEKVEHLCCYAMIISYIVTIYNLAILQYVTLNWEITAETAIDTEK